MRRGRSGHDRDSAFGDQQRDGRLLALSLTEDVARAASRAFRSRYLAGVLHNTMPELASRDPDAPKVSAWLPSDKFLGGYAIGLSTSYAFNGVHGPQYRLQVRVGSETELARGMQKDSLKQFRFWFGSVCLDMATSVDELMRLFRERSLEQYGRPVVEDFFPWFDVSVGSMPRLSAGSRRRVRPGSALSISDSVANAITGGRSSGCITAFVAKNDHPGTAFALSAGHVVTDFGAAPVDTTVQRLGGKEPENIGNYRLPNPFAFSAGKVVPCDAALATIDEGKKVLNQFSYRGRTHTLVGAVAPEPAQLAREKPALCIVRRDKKVTMAKTVAVDASNIFLDRRDNAYHYEDLIEIVAEPKASGRPFVAPGDSGALVFRRQDATTSDELPSTAMGLAMVIGGQTAPGGGAKGYCLTLVTALKTLGVEVMS